MDAILDQFQNQLVGGALTLMLAGSLLGMLYKLPALARWLLVRTMTAEIETRHPSVVRYLSEWLAQTDYGERCRRLKADLRHPPQMDFPVLVMAPGLGLHLVRHGGRWFAVERSREGGDGNAADGPASLLKRDVVAVRTWGRSADPCRRLLQGAIDYVHDRQRREEGVAVMVNGRYDWSTQRVAPHRTLESVVLKRGLQDRVIGDVERFFGRRARYSEICIPWRRIHLYHGPPGCGKSSLARALAGRFEMGLYSLDLGVAELDGHGVQMLLGAVAQRSIVLVEDVDCHGLERDGVSPDADDGTSNVTFSQFLNAFDGVATPEGLFVIFTTNRHPSELDEAVVRRANVVELFPLADKHVARGIFRRFHPDADEQFATDFAAAGEGRKISELQDLLLIHDDGDPRLAIDALDDVDVEDSTAAALEWRPIGATACVNEVAMVKPGEQPSDNGRPSAVPR